MAAPPAQTDPGPTKARRKEAFHVGCVALIYTLALCSGLRWHMETALRSQADDLRQEFLSTAEALKSQGSGRREWQVCEARVQALQLQQHDQEQRYFDLELRHLDLEQQVRDLEQRHQDVEMTLEGYDDGALVSASSNPVPIANFHSTPDAERIEDPHLLSRRLLSRKLLGYYYVKDQTIGGCIYLDGAGASGATITVDMDSTNGCTTEYTPIGGSTTTKHNTHCSGCFVVANIAAGQTATLTVSNCGVANFKASGGTMAHADSSPDFGMAVELVFINPSSNSGANLDVIDGISGSPTEYRVAEGSAAMGYCYSRTTNANQHQILWVKTPAVQR